MTPTRDHEVLANGLFSLKLLDNQAVYVSAGLGSPILKPLLCFWGGPTGGDMTRLFGSSKVVTGRTQSEIVSMGHCCFLLRDTSSETSVSPLSSCI